MRTRHLISELIYLNVDSSAPLTVFGMKEVLLGLSSAHFNVAT